MSESRTQEEWEKREKGWVRAVNNLALKVLDLELLVSHLEKERDALDRLLQGKIESVKQ